MRRVRPKRKHRYNPVDLDLGSRLIAGLLVDPAADVENPDWLVGAY